MFSSVVQKSGIAAMSEPRYHLYVKAGRDGACVGDCPFSQRANMFCRLKGLAADVKIIPINLSAKPESFLKLTKAGSTPVLVDTQTGTVVTDSAEISEYLNKIVPEPSIVPSGDAAVAAASGIFPKFVGFMKNKDSSAEETVKEALISELEKLNNFLKANKSQGKFLVCDDLCDIDCQVLPKLRHVQVAGNHYKGFEIPEGLKELMEYIAAGERHEVFQTTCAPDDEFIYGWKQHME